MTAQIRDHQADPPDERAPNSRQRVPHTHPEDKAVRIEMPAWAHGCLRLSICRKDVQKKFQSELDALYALGEPGSSKAVKL